MTKLRKEFSKKVWENCCGNFCKDCKIASAYKKKYSKKKGHKKQRKDMKKMKEQV